MPIKLGTDLNHYRSKDLPLNHVPLDIINGRHYNHVDDVIMLVTNLHRIIKDNLLAATALLRLHCNHIRIQYQ